MLSTNISHFTEALKEDVRNLCWLQHKYDDDFMYIFCDTKDSMRLLINHIANNIDSHRKPDGDTSIAILTTYNMHACEMLVSQSWIDARIIVPFSQSVDKGVAKIIALQSDIAEALCSSAISESLKCATSCFVSNRADIIFLRLLQTYYDYENAVDDILPVFKPLFQLSKALDFEALYREYDRTKLLEDSMGCIYSARG